MVQPFHVVAFGVQKENFVADYRDRMEHTGTQRYREREHAQVKAAKVNIKI